MSDRIEHVGVRINENDLESGASKILRAIRPHWQLGGVRFKLLTDGITNKLISCLPDDAPDAETVLVRVYGNKTDLLIDRKAETRNILLLSKHGLAPPLYATFENGLAYKYQPGCTLNAELVREPAIFGLVARKMAKLHRVPVEGVARPKPFIWKKCRDFLNLVPEQFASARTQKRYEQLRLPTQTELNEEIIELQQKLEKMTVPVVFCHNDLLLGNVIYTASEGDVTFIDYEYAAFNYQPFDIANHFAEFAGIDPNRMDYTQFPSEEFQKEWIRIYLEEYEGVTPTYSEVHRMYVNVCKFVLVSHLFWGVWALIQAEHSSIDFDYLRFAKARLDEYFSRKSTFLGLE